MEHGQTPLLLPSKIQVPRNICLHARKKDKNVEVSNNPNPEQGGAAWVISVSLWRQSTRVLRTGCELKTGKAVKVCFVAKPKADPTPARPRVSLRCPTVLNQTTLHSSLPPSLSLVTAVACFPAALLLPSPPPQPLPAACYGDHPSVPIIMPKTISLIHTSGSVCRPHDKLLQIFICLRYKNFFVHGENIYLSTSINVYISLMLVYSIRVYL